MEDMGGGDCLGLLNRRTQMEMKDARLYAGEIALAIESLRSIGVVYGDLKPENVFVGSDGHSKLADFGSAKAISDPSTTNSFCGTTEYISPAMLLNKSYSFGGDWWAFGILVYEMIFGGTPFYSKNKSSIYSKIKFADVQHPPNCNPIIIDFIGKFLEKDPMKRAAYQSVEGHPFRGNLRREGIFNKKVSPSFVPIIGRNITAKYFDHEFTSREAADSFGTPMLGVEDIFSGLSYISSTFKMCSI
jgi:serine/threonine protein kinase